MQHDRQLSRLAVQSAKRMEERRIVLLRALWARSYIENTYDVDADSGEAS